MISPEVKSFDSFVVRMGEGKGQILTNGSAGLQPAADKALAE
jgi:hypothetical protein